MKIVLATDGSSGSRLAQAVMEKLPLLKRTRITVASVIRAVASVEIGAVSRTTTYSVGGDVASWQRLHEARRQMLDLLAANLNEEGFISDGLLLEGDAADELLKLVKNDGANLIVTGSGESSDFSAFFLGSVSRKLALNSEASVLIGRSYGTQSHAESIEALGLKAKLSLIIAYDGSEGGDIAIHTLRAIRKPVFDTVSVLAVEPVSDWRFEKGHLFTEPIVESDREYVQELAHRASQEIKHCADRVEWLTGFGRPSVEIARVAALKKADLIVLGANRHGALERWLLGSCAYETATSAPCSVLILRDRLAFTEEQEG